MKINKLFIVLVVLTLSSATLFAGNKATVIAKKGKVEILQNGEWLPVRVNMEISLGTTISTGFKSSAKLDLGDSIVTVSQLSRMKIEELSKVDNHAKTTLFLKVGKVKADVKSSAKLKHNFKFRSPVATASVRGTSFTFTPIQLTVHEGSVDFSNSYGQKGLVIIGQKAQADSEKGINSKKELVSDFVAPILSGESQIEVEPESLEAPSVGSVKITVEYQ